MNQRGIETECERHRQTQRSKECEVNVFRTPLYVHVRKFRKFLGYSRGKEKGKGNRGWWRKIKTMCHVNRFQTVLKWKIGKHVLSILKTCVLNQKRRKIKIG